MVEVDEPASAGSSAPLFPGPGVSLTDLLENDSRHILARFGGTLDDVDHRQLVIDFPDGSIGLAVIDPPTRLDQAKTVVDGRLEPGLPSCEDGIAELQRVPVDDDRGHQVEARRPGSAAPPRFGSPQFAALVEVVA